MNVATDRTMRMAFVLAAAAAVASLAAHGTYAQPPRHGSPHVARGAAVATGPTGPIDTRVVPGLAQPVRPDGAALRSVFDELAARAAHLQRHAPAGQTADDGLAGSGFSWRDAGIGAGVVLLVLVLTVLTVTTHRWKKPVGV